MLNKVTAEEERKIAVLIDADNASYNLVQQVITEVSKYGKITTIRAYADWTIPQLSGWKQVLNQNAITPMQQFAFSVGKNATDSFMIIDAMDLLHSRRFDGFAIISSDSDFTRLATRIREEGLFVMGIGKRLSTQAFVNACEVFVYTDILDDSSLDENQSSGRATKSIEIKDYADAENKIVSAMSNATEDEWVNLAPLGISLRRLYPDFDSRVYGHKRFSDLIIAIPGLEYRREGTIAHVRAVSEIHEEE